MIIATLTQLAGMMTQSTLLLEEPEDEIKPRKGGSRKGSAANLPCDFESAYQLLIKHYFAENPLYSPYIFRRRFQMSRNLFLLIVSKVKNHDSYFVQKSDALGRPGLRPLQKITSAIRMLAYGGAADANDEYLQMSESTTLESLI
jgi:hypothetical protein